MTIRSVAFTLSFFALAACGGRIVPPATVADVPKKSAVTPTASAPMRAAPIAPAAPVKAEPGTSAATSGVQPGPNYASFKISEAAAARALKAFRLSCAALLKRTDLSGLTRTTDWQPLCSAAPSVRDGEAGAFFSSQFEIIQIGAGSAFATGYYEPDILGSRTRISGYDTPVYRKPPELVEVDLGQFSETLKGKKIRGRVNGNSFIPYADRTQIEEGALAGRGLEIAWAKDPVDFFVLQIQGSGRLNLPDGSVMRIGYEGQNGRDYTGIGRVMRERGLLQPGKATMQDIENWLRANPDQGRNLMRENRSWVFFRELTGPGPLGALNVPVGERVSVAADPMFVPLGAPVLLSMERPEASGLWVAQDTGGAIKGANRFDTFWGAGDEARRIAGGMSSRGTAFLLLPKGTIGRLNGGPTP